MKRSPYSKLLERSFSKAVHLHGERVGRAEARSLMNKTPIAILKEAREREGYL